MNAPVAAMVKLQGKAIPKAGSGFGVGSAGTGRGKQDVAAETKKPELSGNEAPFVQQLEQAKTRISQGTKKTVLDGTPKAQVKTGKKVVKKTLPNMMKGKTGTISRAYPEPPTGKPFHGKNILSKVVGVKTPQTKVAGKPVPGFILNGEISMAEESKTSGIIKPDTPVSKITRPKSAPNTSTAVKIIDWKTEMSNPEQKTTGVEKRNPIPEQINLRTDLPGKERPAPAPIHTKKSALPPGDPVDTNRNPGNPKVANDILPGDSRVDLRKKAINIPLREHQNAQSSIRPDKPLENISHRRRPKIPFAKNPVSMERTVEEKPRAHPADRRRPIPSRAEIGKPPFQETTYMEKPVNPQPELKNTVEELPLKPAVKKTESREAIPKAVNRHDPKRNPVFTVSKNLKAVPVAKSIPKVSAVKSNRIGVEKITQPKENVRKSVQKSAQNTEPSDTGNPKKEALNNSLTKSPNTGSNNRTVPLHDSAPASKLDFWIQSLTKQVRLETTVRQAYLIEKISQIVDLVEKAQPKSAAQISIQDNRVGKLDVVYNEKSDGRQITITVENESVRQQLQKIVPLIQENLNQKGQSALEMFVQLKQEMGQKQELAGRNRSVQEPRKATGDHQKQDRGAVAALPPELIKHYGYNTIEMVA